MQERILRWVAVGLIGLLVYSVQAAGAQEKMLLPPVMVAPKVASAVAMPDTSISGALRSMASRAGLVFVGRVEKMARKGGVVETTFGVEQVVLGAAGATYTLREWGGLWAAGEQRYQPGQRAMVFLHAASAAGLSSPVDGMEGVIPLVPMGADVAPLLDVRRLAARVQRALGQVMSGEAMALPDAVVAVSHWKTPLAEPEMKRLPVGWKPGPVTAEQRMGGAMYATR